MKYLLRHADNINVHFGADILRQAKASKPVYSELYEDLDNAGLAESSNPKWRFILSVCLTCIAGILVLNNPLKAQPQNDFTLGLSFIDYSEWDSAKHYLGRAAFNNEAHGEWDDFFLSFYYLGYCHSASNDLKGLLEYESLLVPNLDCENTDLPTICILMGMAHRKQWNLERALDYYDLVIENTSEDHSDQIKLISSAHNNKGVVYRNMGDYDQALIYYEKWLAYNNQNNITLKPFQLANTYSNIAIVQKFRKDHPSAIASYQKALGLLNEIKKLRPREAKLFATIHNNLGALYLTEEKPDSSLIFLHKNLVELPPDPRILADTYEFIGESYLQKGDFKTAKDTLFLAIKQKEVIFNQKHPRLGRAYYRLGNVLLEENKLDSALLFFQKGIVELTNAFEVNNIYQNPTSDQVYFKNHMITSLTGKGNAFRKLYGETANQRDLEASFSAFQLASALGDEIKRHYQTKASKLLLVESIVPAFEGGIETAEQLFRLTGDGKYLADAYSLATKSKATILREVIEKDQAQQKLNLPDSLIRTERQLQRQLAEYEKQIFEISDSSRLRAFKEKRFTIWEEIKKFEETLEASYPEYFQLQFSESMSLGEIQAQLKPQTVMLDYFWGQTNLVIFSITRQKVKLHKIPLEGLWQEELKQMINLVRNYQLAESEGIGGQQLRSFSEISYALYQELVEPLLPKSIQKIIVIPDGELGYLPFDLLLTNPFDSTQHKNYSSLPYLLKTHLVRSGFSSDLNPQKSSAKNQPEHLFGGFAPSYGVSSKPVISSRSGNEDVLRTSLGFSNLANNDKEVLTISKTLKGTAFLNEEARESTFHAEARKYRILHIASHGFVNPANPALSGLALSPEADFDSLGTNHRYNGLLQAYEISLMDLPAEMVVLSACETGSGKLEAGEGVMSLARAFAYAGCPNMVMSYWKADDFTAEKVMTSFYRHLKDGVGKDEALRQAKIEYLNSSDLNHPFYWGAFVLVGDDEKIISNGNLLYWLLGLVLLVGIAIGGRMVLKKKS